MSDPLENYVRGQPLSFRADTLNAWNEAARRVRGEKYDGGALAALDEIFPCLTAIVRNDTGANLPARSVVYLSDWIVSPVTYPFDAQARPVFKAITPAATTNAIGILRDAIPDGEMGRAIVAGIAVADVLVNSSGHTYAQPIASDNTRLGSVASGPIRIIKWETSGATRRAYVLMGEGAAGGVTVEEEDGTPSVNASTIKFPNTSLTDNGDGTVSVRLADSTHAGMVSVGDQDLWGTKSLLTSPLYSSEVLIADVTWPVTNHIGIDYVGASGPATNLPPQIASYTKPWDGVSVGSGDGGELYLAMDGNTLNPRLVLTSLGSGVGNQCKFSVQIGSTASSIADGATGASGGGDTVTGGIITSLGSGPSGIDGGTF